MKRHMLAATTGLALVSLLTLGASRASADVFTFEITSDHCDGSNGCIAVNGASAGTITITDTASNTVLIDVALKSGYEFHNGGFGADFGFNLDPNLTITYSGLASPFIVAGVPAGTTEQSAGALQMDGAGIFEYGVQCAPQQCSGTTGPSSLSFTITGSSLSTSSFVTNGTPEFQYFALDIAGNGNTGAVDASVRTPSSVPDGGVTLMLLGGVLLGVETLRRRVRA